MKLRIPLNLAGTPPFQAAPGGFRLRLPVGSSGPTVGPAQATSSRQTQALRAVAAATALYDVGATLELVKRAEDAPEDVIDPSLDADKLNRVLNAVGRVQDQPGDAPKASKSQIAAAAAVLAGPELVAAAAAAIDGGTNKAERDALAAEARKWVAAVDPVLLATAARAGATTEQLGRVPTQTSRLDRVEASISRLDERVTRIEKARS